MPRGHDWQPGRHRLQNGVWYAFLVFIRRRLAGMQEKMRTRVKLHQFRLRDKPAEMNSFRNSQLCGQSLELWLQGAFAGDPQFRFRIFFQEHGKRAQRCGDAFFRNQAAGLENLPPAILWRVAANKWEIPRWNARAINADMLSAATQSPPNDQPTIVSARVSSGTASNNCRNFFE